jgi:DNA-binding beta-propeller fold protein YncE
MDTNLSVTDPLLIARQRSGSLVTEEWRTIGRSTYFVSNVGAPTRSAELSDYVVPTFDGASDFDPSALWKLLTAISATRPVRLGTSTLDDERVTNFRVVLSTARFVEQQGISGSVAGPGPAPENPIQLLLTNVGGSAWLSANPYTSNTTVRVTVLVGSRGVEEIEFLGVVPGGHRQLYTETFTASANGVRVAIPRPGPMPPATPCLSTTVTPSSTIRTRTTYSPTIGSAFGVVTTADGRYSFVANQNSIGVYSDASFTPRLIAAVSMANGQPLGEALTSDGRYLLVAVSTGAEVLDVAALEAGEQNAVLGQLTVPGGAGGIEVALSADDQFAFVTLEDSGSMAVFNLADALASNFATSGFVGSVPLGNSPVGIAIAPNGGTMYVTSESTSSSSTSDGTLSVLNVPTAETNPSDAVLSTVAAGCGPVRVVTSTDGSVVWVTARGSNQLLAFSASALAAKSSALLARVGVGQSPVDLTFVDNGTRLLVADSNRFFVQGATSGLTVVDPAAALAGDPAIVGTVATGLFPREFSLEPKGSIVLVTDYESSELEAVSVTGLP